MNSKTLKVLLLTDEMLPGGVSRHVIDLANGLNDREVYVMVAATDGPFRNRLHEHIHFEPLRLLKSNSYDKDILGFPAAFLKLRKIIRQNGVQLIHTHKRYADLLGRMLARDSHIFHLSSCHNTFDNLKLVSVFGDYTIACSHAVQNNLMENFHLNAKNLKTIYYGIKPFSEISGTKRIDAYDKFGIPHQKKIISSVGQLIKTKDRETLLHAIHVLHKMADLNDIIFIILGDGHLKDHLIRTRNELGLENIVHFVSGTSDVELLFNISEFMVLSSVREGFGYVFLEAASLGKPHIATNVGGVSEAIVHDQTGVLVPPKNPDALANAMKAFLLHPGMVSTMGESAKKRFEEKFEYQRFIDETLGTYRTLLKSPYDENTAVAFGKK